MFEHGPELCFKTITRRIKYIFPRAGTKNYGRAQIDREFGLNLIPTEFHGISNVVQLKNRTI